MTTTTFFNFFLPDSGHLESQNGRDPSQAGWKSRRCSSNVPSGTRIATRTKVWCLRGRSWKIERLGSLEMTRQKGKPGSCGCTTPQSSPVVGGQFRPPGRFSRLPGFGAHHPHTTPVAFWIMHGLRLVSKSPWELVHAGLPHSVSLLYRAEGRIPGVDTCPTLPHDDLDVRHCRRFKIAAFLEILRHNRRCSKDLAFVA